MLYFNMNCILMTMTVVSVSCVYSPAKETEIRSETVLSAAYDATSRPESQTHVFIGLSVLAIDALDIKDQKFTTAGWLTFEWHDDRLKWNKTAKDDIKYIFAKPKDIWRPEIVIDNSLADLGVIHDDELMLRIKYDGTVDWEPLILFETHCNVDITYYPYDKQKCAIEVVSWGYNYNEIMLEHVSSEVGLDDYVENGEWKVMRTYIEDKNLTEHTTHGIVIYPQLDFWFYMDRRTDYYNLNVLMPIFLNSLLIGLVFLVPVISGEKLQYVLTVQLSLAVLLTVVNDNMPSTSITTSVLGIYLGIVLILGGIAVLLTVFVCLLFFREGEMNLNCFAAKIARIGAKMFCTTLGSRKETDNMTKVRPVSVDDNGDVVETNPDGEFDVTWQDISAMINRMCYYIFVATTVTMNFAFFLALGFGGEAW